MTATLSSALLWLATGALLGGLYWLTLRWSSAMLAAGGPLVRAFVLQVIRFAALGIVLAGVAIRGGTFALLVSAGGLMVARSGVLHLVGKE